MHVARIRLREAGKAFDFDTGGLQLVPGDHCIVQTDRGQEYGIVVSETRINPPGEPPEAGLRVVRLATPDDKAQVERQRGEERDVLRVCQAKIDEHELPMKLVDAERSFDGSKTTFYFTAEGRVDFRELVKDLAREFRTRIELRQIGVRDEAKMAGGMGPCGLTCCCCTFLQRFEPVSIRMAREQRLSLNPSKISGLCGRLMCCLTYESDAYRSFNRKYKCEGATVDTPMGPAKVKALCMVKESAKIQLEDGRAAEIPVTDIGRKPEPVFEEPVAEEPPPAKPPVVSERRTGNRPQRRPGRGTGKKGTAKPAAAGSGEAPGGKQADAAPPKTNGSPRRSSRRRRRRRKPGGGQKS